MHGTLNSMIILTLQLAQKSRDSTNPFVEQAVQYAVAVATSILNDRGKKDVLQKLLLQGHVENILEVVVDMFSLIICVIYALINLIFYSSWI